MFGMYVQLGWEIRNCTSPLRISCHDTRKLGTNVNTIEEGFSPDLIKKSCFICITTQIFRVNVLEKKEKKTKENILYFFLIWLGMYHNSTSKIGDTGFRWMVDCPQTWLIFSSYIRVVNACKGDIQYRLTMDESVNQTLCC